MPNSDNGYNGKILLPPGANGTPPPNRRFPTFWFSIIVTIALAVLAAIGGFVWFTFDIRNDLDTLSATVDIRFDSVDRRFDDLNRRLDELSNRIDELSRLVYTLLQRQLEDETPPGLPPAVPPSFSFTPEGSFTLMSLSATQAGREFQPILSNGSQLHMSTVIGVSETGTEVLVGDVAGERFLSHHVEHGLDVWLHGGFNANGQLHGLFTAVVMANGELRSYYETEYHNGVMLGAYRAIHRFFERNPLVNSYRYAFSERILHSDFNDGITRVFADIRFTGDDILAIHRLRYGSFEGLDLISMYSGRNAVGLHNDTSGSAFFIAFTADGYVRLFYQGGITNGAFEDDSGAAFWLVLADDRTRYLHYTGAFSDGQPTASAWFDNPPSFWVDDPVRFVPYHVLLQARLKWLSE